jgi:hypothetical protein
VGRCERALLHARVGRAPSPFPEKIQAAMDRSAALETTVIAAFGDQYEIDVIERQRRVVIPVAEGVEIRGSIDGVGVSTSQQYGLVEIKAFGDSYWNQFVKGGIAAFPEYVAQFQIYLAGLRLKYRHEVDIDSWLEGGWFVVGHSNTDGFLVTRNGKPEIRFEWVPFSAATMAKAKAKVMRVEAAHEAMQGGQRVELELPCTEDYGCPYWTLHPEKAAVENVEMALKLEEIGEVELEVQRLKARIAALKAGLKPTLVSTDGHSVKVMTKYGDVVATWVPDTTTTTLDKAAIAADQDSGVIPESWKKTTTRAGFVKITPTKGEK